MQTRFAKKYWLAKGLSFHPCIYNIWHHLLSAFAKASLSNGVYGLGALLQREPSRRFSAFFKYAASRSFSNKLVPQFSQPVHSRETVNVGIRQNVFRSSYGRWKSTCWEYTHRIVVSNKATMRPTLIFWVDFHWT